MLLPNTAVTRILIADGEVIGVETTRGRIDAPIVVDAAGAWTRHVAEASGIQVPLVTTAQQLFITEPVPDARAELPMVRIMDAAVYTRPCEGGFLWGVYEESPRFFDMNDFDANFDIKDLSLDAEVLWRYGPGIFFLSALRPQRLYPVLALSICELWLRDGPQPGGLECVYSSLPPLSDDVRDNPVVA
ncbi:glycine/D-amino acid oxidase-like deaminating enzyme [Paraburkholderia youngii]